MAFGKKAKTPKTQYQTENQQLGRDAYGRITPALDRLESLSMNPDEYRQRGINTYFNSSADWNDAMRQYRRQMNQATANNYNAMNGGYSSAGQKYYDDTQRYANDLNSRLYDRGVQTVNNMLSQDTGLAQNYYNTLMGQHDLAAQPDAIDTANQLIDQANKNSWSNILGTAGKVVSAIPTPWTRAIGAGMQLGGYAGSTDYSNAIANVLNNAGTPTSTASYTNPSANVTNVASSLGDAAKGIYGDKSYWANLFKRGGTVSNTTQGTPFSDAELNALYDKYVRGNR